MKVTLKVSGMSCAHCSRRVETALAEVAGVSSAKVDLAGGTATVECAEGVSADTLSGAVREAGYEVVS